MDKMYTLDDINSQTIVKIAQHFIDSDLSLRKFCEAYGKFSYITLREKFLTFLPLVNKEIALVVQEKLEMKRPKKIEEDLKAQERIAKAISLLLDQDMTVLQIALELNSTEMTIYRDLTVRINQLPISNEIKKEVLSHLREHSLNNLISKGR